MQCYEYVADGAAYRLKITTRPDPTPGPERVVVKVYACSLNYRDHINLKNLASRPVGGVIPLSDGAGEVVAIGAGVTTVKVGDRVMGNFFSTWLRGPFDMAHHKSALGGTGCDGVLAEFAELPADAVVPIPEFMTYDEAACLPCAGLTAWVGLTTPSAVAREQSVLTLGTGGVSVFAIQFAHAMGCRIIATSSSDDKLERAKQLGASDTINYRTSAEWDKDVFRLTNKRGVDRVIEVGGSGTLAKSMASVAASGHIALIGVLTGFGPPTESLFPLVAKNATMTGIYVGSVEQFQAMNAFLERHTIRPVIDRVFAFADAERAFEHLASANHFGKIVIRVAT